jgi:hypothetical protein
VSTGTIHPTHAVHLYDKAQRLVALFDLVTALDNEVEGPAVPTERRWAIAIERLDALEATPVSETCLRLAQHIVGERGKDPFEGLF